MQVNEKINAVQQYIKAFAKADINIIKTLYAEDATVEDPVGRGVHRGLEAICRFYQTALDSGATLSLNGTPRCAGNAVAFPFTVHSGPVNIEIIDVFEFNEQGKISTMRAYWGQENIIR